MSYYQSILFKLNQFIKKYYYNELIKGSIMFLTLGFLILLLTLYVEYFLWLKPNYRLVLLIVFIALELFLLYRYIIIPILKLIGLKKGITHQYATKIIGQHFSEIDDKLLNTLQLYDNAADSELVLASVEQKSASLDIFSFKQAINYKFNAKYLKYLLLPIGIYLLTIFFTDVKQFNQSYKRLSHPNIVYTPPAPFKLHLLNDSLKIIEGNDLEISIGIDGNILPEELSIMANDNSFFMLKQQPDLFTYTFSNVTKSFSFLVSSNEVSSNNFEVQVIKVPKITDLKMILNYPSYTGKSSDIINHSGNATVPDGTMVSWQVQTNAANLVSLIDVDNDKVNQFKKSENKYRYSKQVREKFNYLITVSNDDLKNYEKLNFNIDIQKDAFPKLFIQTDIDSLKDGEAHFVGRLSDDYGISKLNLFYYKVDNPNEKKIHTISVDTKQIVDFQFVFPGILKLEDSQNYALYFEVYDNDIVNGLKSVKSNVYTYYKPSDVELKDQFLKQQEETIDQIDNLINKQQKNQKQFENLEKNIKNTSKIDFNTEERLRESIKRHDNYDKILNNKYKELEKQLDKQNTSDDKLNNKKEAIKERIKEALDNKLEQDILDELDKLSKELDKEDLIKKMQKMSSHSKYKEKSLKELLELTKRFYVEQQLQQVLDKTKKLADKQDNLSKQTDKNTEEQSKLNKETEELNNQIDKMDKSNKDLKKPMSIQDEKSLQKQIEQDQKKALQDIHKDNKSSAKKNQKKAAQKLQSMASSFEKMLSSISKESIEEDVESLKRILDNLLKFSFEQENLMELLNNEAQQDLNISYNLKQQNLLKTYFQHIDDSLYTLSMRQEMLSKDINKHLEDVHYYLNQSITTMEDNKIPITRSHQQYVMKGANDLAYILNTLLDNLSSPPPMMCDNPQMGEGAPKFALPDIIKKQSELKQQSMENKSGEQNKPSLQEGGKKQSNSLTEQNSESLYNIYKEQSMLREALKQQLEQGYSTEDKKQISHLVKKMEELENMLLDKGITNDVLKRMQNLEHQLLKLKEATYEQEEDNKRISKTNKSSFDNTNNELYQKFLDQLPKDEILNREPLPFQSQINLRINQYFRENNN